MPKLLDVVRPLVDQTIDRLSRKQFVTDPLVGEELSRTTSIVSSAYKRHGGILESALLERLRMEPHLEVWQDRAVTVSQAANQMSDIYIGNHGDALNVVLPYDAAGVRTLQVDLIVFNRETNAITSYEVKRGAGTHDAGKRRSMMRDLLCMQFMLQSYGSQRLQVACGEARSKIIIYYGAENLGPVFTLTRNDLDAHFGSSVVADIEKVNDYFREKIDALIKV